MRHGCGETSGISSGGCAMGGGQLRRWQHPGRQEPGAAGHSAVLRRAQAHVVLFSRGAGRQKRLSYGAMQSEANRCEMQHMTGLDLGMEARQQLGAEQTCPE